MDNSTLFISGAAFHILLEMGALKHILSVGSFTNFVGTSSGSYLSLAMVLGWTPDTMYNFMISSYPNTVNQLDESIWRLLFSGSLISNTGRDAFLSSMITNSPIYLEHFTSVDPTIITFQDLANVTDINFLCNSVCYDSQKMVLFSKWTTPSASIHSAVSASMSLLGMFEPTTINQFKYIDGGFLSDYIATIFDPDSSSYYKVLYPTIDIPITLSTSWGCLNMSNTIINGIVNPSPSGSWSLWKLISFIPQLFTYASASSIREEPLYILKQRSWTVYSDTSSIKLPNVTDGKAMFYIGYNQAIKQGTMNLI